MRGVTSLGAPTCAWKKVSPTPCCCVCLAVLYRLHTNFTSVPGLHQNRITKSKAVKQDDTTRVHILDISSTPRTSHAEEPILHTMPPPTKRRRTEPVAVEEITFDLSARHEYLTGFHKRKVQRAKQAQEAAEKRARAERIEHRKQVCIT